MKISVVAHPSSRKPRVEVDLFGSLHVYVAEPALEGKANEAVRAALAAHFDVAKSRVALVRGQRGKLKAFEVEDLEPV